MHPEIIGSLRLPPSSDQSGILTNGLRIGKGGVLTDEYLSEHDVRINLIAEATESGSPDTFAVAMHSIMIDGVTVYTFEAWV